MTFHFDAVFCYVTDLDRAIVFTVTFWDSDSFPRKWLQGSTAMVWKRILRLEIPCRWLLRRLLGRHLWNLRLLGE